MRVLRSTLINPHLEPMTVVVRDSDIVDSLESARESQKDFEAFCVFDIFEMPDGGIEEATVAAMARFNEDDERNQAIMYYWTIMQFPMVADSGHVIMPAPAPLDADQIKAVYDMISRHPDYAHQTIQSTSKDGERVVMQDGVIQ